MRTFRRTLIEEDSVLIINPCIAKKLGRSGAIFLQQLHYWITSDNDMGCTFEGKRWIYNTYESWGENIKIYSQSTIRRAVRKLEKMGIILSKNINRKKSDHTKWYTIDYTKLEMLIPSSSALETKEDQNRLVKMNRPSVQNEQIIYKETEITSESLSITEGKVGFQKSVTTEPVHFVQEKNSQIKNNLAQDLLAIWNETVGKHQGEGGTIYQLTKKRAQYLVAAFKARFESNLERWKDFCRVVSTSDLLMGRIKTTFKGSLDWILRFDVIQQIFEGCLGVKERFKLSPNNASCSQEILTQQIEERDEPDKVKHLRKAILQSLGEKVYQSWFTGIKIIERGGSFEFQTTSSFVRDYIQTHYLGKLEKSIEGRFCVVLPFKNVSSTSMNIGDLDRYEPETGKGSVTSPGILC